MLLSPYFQPLFHDSSKPQSAVTCRDLTGTPKGKQVDIPREMVIQMIRSKGDFEAATRAEQELPEKVDTDADAELLSGFSISPSDFAEGEEGLSGQQPNAG